MHLFSSSRSRCFLLGVGLILATATPTESAWAMKNRTIVLRAAGSGALIGVAAGIVSYPFAKSTGTIIAGALVGAALGTVYGFYLVDKRDQSYRATALADLYAENSARDAILRRGRPIRAELFVPVSVLEF